MDVVRTPDERFAGLSGYPFSPHYTEVKGARGTGLRMHHLDEGARDAPVILCLHGQPSWSYLYRKMVPLLTGAGYRVIAPDLIGFGRSDKPTAMADYTYDGHVAWLNQWLAGLDLTDVTLVCQDWGGLIGLRVVADQSERFARLVIANTGLPSSDTVTDEVADFLGSLWPSVPVPDAEMLATKFAERAPDAFLYWVKYASEYSGFSVRDVFGMLSGVQDPAVLAGYVAPFPDGTYLAGARAFPTLVPLLPHHKKDREANDRAWAVLDRFERPVLTAFSDGDPVTAGGEIPFQTRIPGAQEVAHVTIHGAGHFLQEDKPQALSDAVIHFMASTGA